MAYAVHESGVREVIGLDIGEVCSGAFWTEFLRSLKARGLEGVVLAISDSHEGLKAAIARMPVFPWQRCTVHFFRDMVMHWRSEERNLLTAALREFFRAESRLQARERVGQVIERLEEVAPKVSRYLEEAEEDLIAFYGFPQAHWPKLRSSNPLERVNKEIGRRTDVVGIFPNNAAAIRLVGALLTQQNDEWLVSRRYLSADSIAAVGTGSLPASASPLQRTRALSEAQAQRCNDERRWLRFRPAEPRALPTSSLHHYSRLDCTSARILLECRRWQLR